MAAETEPCAHPEWTHCTPGGSCLCQHYRDGPYSGIDTPGLRVIERDGLDLAIYEVERCRLEREWIWSDTGGDYYGDRYQAAQIAYDKAIAIHNSLVHDPFSRGTF